MRGQTLGFHEKVLIWSLFSSCQDHKEPHVSWQLSWQTSATASVLTYKGVSSLLKRENMALKTKHICVAYQTSLKHWNIPLLGARVFTYCLLAFLSFNASQDTSLISFFMGFSPKFCYQGTSLLIQTALVDPPRTFRLLGEVKCFPRHSRFHFNSFYILMARMGFQLLVFLQVFFQPSKLHPYCVRYHVFIQSVSSSLVLCWVF